MNKEKRKWLLPMSAIAILILALTSALVVFRIGMSQKQGETTQNGDDAQPPTELQFCLPFEWFAGTQNETLAIHLEEVNTVERKDEGFEISLTGTASLIPNEGAYSIEMRVKVDSDGIGYYVSDIISFYCTDNPNLHNEFETVGRDCLSFMEKRLVGP